MFTPSESDAPIPLSVPEIRGNEWAYVKDCLDSGWVSSAGVYVERFEEALRKRLGARHAVATVNGTAALHVALLAAGVQPGDEALVSTLTFIAPVNAIRYAGAWPVFIDAEREYWQMDPGRVAAFVEQGCAWTQGELRNLATGRRVRAILPVHILGHPVEMTPILEIARRYRLAVIEDATESLGALHRDVPAGRLGDIACFSFNGNKIITTGGGGMIVTDHDAWAAQARYLTTQAKDDPIEYIHREIGYNYRLTNLQAAMGCAQLERLDEYLAAKRRIAENYARELNGIPGITLMPEAPWARASYWLYTILVDGGAYGRDSRTLLRALDRAGIQARPLWQPIHRSPAHASTAPADCPVADRLYCDALSLPCSVGLSAADQQRVCDVIRHGRA